MDFIIGINSAPRWNQIKDNYEQYAVTGLSVRWIKASTLGTRTEQQVAATINYAWMYEDIDTLDIAGYTDNQILALETFKNVNKNGFKVYRNNKPLAKVDKAEW